MSILIDSRPRNSWCKCPKCGVQMELGVIECLNCGYALSQVEINEVEKRFKNQRMKGILFGVVFFTVFFAGLIWYFNKM